MLVGSVLPAIAQTVEHVIIERSGIKTHVAGELIVEAQDGGVLLLAPDSATDDDAEESTGTEEAA